MFIKQIMVESISVTNHT